MALNRWARSLKRLNTKRGYVNSLLVYCRFLQLTPTQARDEAKYEQIKNVFKSDRWIREHLKTSAIFCQIKTSPQIPPIPILMVLNLFTLFMILIRVSNLMRA